MAKQANPRESLSGEIGSVADPTVQLTHGWSTGWHASGARRYPTDFRIYDDPLRLFREYLVPGHAPDTPLLSPGDPVVTLGSCFAQELREVLELAGFGSSSVWIPAGLNNTYALLDWVSWAVTGEATHRAHRYERREDGAISEWHATEDRDWYARHLAQAGAFVFTLGLAEVWMDKTTDRVYWRGVPNELYDAETHELRLTTVGENVRNLEELIRIIRDVNPTAPIVLTLSPVPLLATFRAMPCMSADAVSKAVLRVALDHVVSAGHQGVWYWPSFELIRSAGSGFDHRVWGSDARHVHRYLVQCIVDEFVRVYYGEAALQRLQASVHRERPIHPMRRGLHSAQDLSKRALARASRLTRRPS